MVLNEYAVLSATNSEGGRKMLERKHRLRVGEQGIVGNVTATGKPRIAMDVGVDAVFFDNPELAGYSFRNGTASQKRWTCRGRTGCAKHGNRRVCR